MPSPSLLPHVVALPVLPVLLHLRTKKQHQNSKAILQTVFSMRFCLFVLGSAGPEACAPCTHLAHGCTRVPPRPRRFRRHRRAVVALWCQHIACHDAVALRCLENAHFHCVRGLLAAAGYWRAGKPGCQSHTRPLAAPCSMAVHTELKRARGCIAAAAGGGLCTCALFVCT